MGFQDEYLRNFCILMTDKGVVPLTDPMQIKVYELLKTGAKRPSDLTSALGIGSSSLHFVLDKLTESNVIYKIKPESDKKLVYYATGAVEIASTKDSNDELRAMSLDAFSDRMPGYTGLSAVSNMLDCYTSEIGLDVDPVKRRYARDLADAIECNGTTLEEAVLDIRQQFFRVTGFNFVVFSFDPFTLVLSGDSTVRHKAYMLTQFISRMIENCTGTTYAMSSVEDFGSGGGPDTKLKITFKREEPEKDPYLNMSLHRKDDHRFIMMDVDGSAGIMNSDVQIDIIDAVYERPLCITDIVNKVDFPRSTITSNLLRMVEEGVMSVFYSESGAAYYGLACSILAKKSREMTLSKDEIRDIVDSIANKDGAFMEGLLLYTLAFLRSLGFDTEYLMVVLGAKYMRSAGAYEDNNFDAHFGKMSDIARTIGLSLNVVSVYPLTIGISSEGPSSANVQAMTFIKGMAHQGLEMASNGIFVRSSEDTPEKRNISFKEIYPALSMTPVKGIPMEDVEALPVKKKRTTSVKTALLYRGVKNNSKQRTVRYITGMAFMLLFAAVIMFGMTGMGQEAEGETYTLTLDGSLGASVYDCEDNLLAYPFTFDTDVTLCIVSPEENIGYVSNGVAYRMTANELGQYMIHLNKNTYLERLYDASPLLSLDCDVSVYCSPNPIVGNGFQYMPSDEYIGMSGGLFVSYNNSIEMKAHEGFCISSGESFSSMVPFQSYHSEKLGFLKVSTREMPSDVKTLALGDSYFYIEGQLVTGTIAVQAEATSIDMRVSDKDVRIIVNGEEVDVGVDNHFTAYLVDGENTIVVKPENLS